MSRIVEKIEKEFSVCISTALSDANRDHFM